MISVNNAPPRGCDALVALLVFFVSTLARAATPVTITIDTTKTGATTSQTFAGLSFETALMLPKNGHHYFRPENKALLAMFKQLNIRSLRIGGNTADRETVPEPSDADIDSLFEFARAADVKVLYTLRLKGHDDPSDAAKVAKYIWSKYKENVECFAIGNEPNMYVDDPKQYCALMKKYAEAIDSPDVAPGAKFSGPGSTPGKVVWSRELADTLGPSGKIGLITQHSYPGGSARRVSNPTTSRAFMLSEKWIDSYQKFYDSFVPTVKNNNIGYRLEESNSFFYGGALDVSDTFAAALWALDFMHWWAQHDCTGINFHTGDAVDAGETMSPSRYAVFWTSDKGYHAHPLAYGIKAFGLGSRGTYVDTSIKSDEALNLTAYAVRGDDNALYVTLINKECGDGARTASVKFELPQAFEKAEWMLLGAPRNDLSGKEHITLGDGEIRDDGGFDGKWTTMQLSTSNVTHKTNLTIELPAGVADVIRLTPR
jgi:hypothetical protein